MVLICIFLMISDFEHLVMYLLDFCMSSLEKCLLRFSDLFFVVVMSYMSSLYILDINPLSDRLFANIFPHSVSCLFILFVSFFAI